MSLTDPTSGIGYAFGAKLPSSHMTTIATQQPNALDYVNGGTYTCANAMTTTNTAALTQTFNGAVARTYGSTNSHTATAANTTVNLGTRTLTVQGNCAVTFANAPTMTYTGATVETYSNTSNFTYTGAAVKTYSSTASITYNDDLGVTMNNGTNSIDLDATSSLGVVLDGNTQVGGAGTLDLSGMTSLIAVVDNLRTKVNANVTADANATLAAGSIQRVKMTPTTTRTLTLPNLKAGSLFLLQVENNSGGGHAININSPAAVQVASVSATSKGGMLFVYTADNYPICFLVSGSGVSTSYNPSI